MKKSISIIAAFVLLLSFSAAALAAELPDSRPAPVNVERKNINGDEYIIKIYELPPDSDPATLIETDFEDGGYTFSHYTTTSAERATEERKPVTSTVSAEGQSKELSEVLKRFASTLPYECDGFTGTLVLDAGSIVTEASGYKTVTSTISDTKEFTGMMYADPSGLPQSTVKNGTTLPLSDVSWTVIGTSLAGDSLVPTEYKATAVYSEKVSSQMPTGYISTATYMGEVCRSEISAVAHTLTYKGTPIPTSEPEPTPEPTPEPVKSSDPFPLGVSTRGIGRETADSILLYAFKFSTFVVDTYTIRLCERYPLKAGHGYEAVKSYFESNLPKGEDIYNRLHALIVINAKEYCRKKPVCAYCSLRGSCAALS